LIEEKEKKRKEMILRDPHFTSTLKIQEPTTILTNSLIAIYNTSLHKIKIEKLREPMGRIKTKFSVMVRYPPPTACPSLPAVKADRYSS
jgi:hypothetical protein